MKKLVSISVKELPRPMISIFPNNIHEANTSEEPDKVELNFFVPDYLVFAAFDDSTLNVRGILIDCMADLPYDVYEEHPETLRDNVSLNMVKAFVGTIIHWDETTTEQEAKKEVLEGLHDSGIKVDEEVKNYLNWYETYN